MEEIIIRISAYELHYLDSQKMTSSDPSATGCKSKKLTDFHGCFAITDFDTDLFDESAVAEGSARHYAIT